eukprot:4621908-Amphidinium_carterae.1
MRGMRGALVAVEAVITRGRPVIAVALHGTCMMKELRSSEDANHGLVNALGTRRGDLSVPEEDTHGLGSVGKVAHSFLITK